MSQDYTPRVLSHWTIRRQSRYRVEGRVVIRENPEDATGRDAEIVLQRRRLPPRRDKDSAGWQTVAALGVVDEQDILGRFS